MNIKKQIALQMMYELEANPYCPVTNEHLIPGINCSLDHIIPISQQPELALDPNNMRWVSKVYNQAKGAMSDEDFATRYDFKCKDPEWAVREKERKDAERAVSAQTDKTTPPEIPE